MATTLSAFLTDLGQNPEKVETLLKDPQHYLTSSGLPEEDQQLLKSRDWPAIQQRLNDAFRPESFDLDITVKVVVPVVVVVV